MLAGNQLTSLPIEMANCTELELLRIAANKFTRLPEWLLTLPKLSWLAYGGNPLAPIFDGDVSTGEVPSSEKSIPQIAWQDIDLLDKLGEGASGHIFRARLRTKHAESLPSSVFRFSQSDGDGDDSTVAVKLFKGGTTSDGRPEDEMQATISLGGAHPYFLGAIGEVVGAPQAQRGLVLPLVSPRLYSPLGGPPSFSSVTRDQFTPDQRFPLAVVLRLLVGVATACLHLHAEKRIVHGDLYAHNILCTREGAPLLTDFGAASFKDPAVVTAAQSLLLERVEVRAFGCLVEDLLDRVEEGEKTEEGGKGTDDASGSGDAALLIVDPISLALAFVLL